MKEFATEGPSYDPYAEMGGALGETAFFDAVSPRAFELEPQSRLRQLMDRVAGGRPKRRDRDGGRGGGDADGNGAAFTGKLGGSGEVAPAVKDAALAGAGDSAGGKARGESEEKMGKPKGERGVDWNEQAGMYSQFAFCELDDTRAYLDAIGVAEGDSVLDVCCGPGRVSVLAAERGASVVGIDSAEKMLERARENAGAMGVADRCEFRLLDWDHVLPGQNLQPADVVIASRCRAMMDVDKLSALARRTVGVQIFANAPSIPALLGVLFSGCGEDDGPGRRPETLTQGDRPTGTPTQGDRLMPGGPGGPGQRPDGPGAKRAIYLKIAQKAFEAGYDPNIRIFPERFRKTFASADEAVAWVAALKPDRAEGNMDRLATNVAPFLTEVDGGVEFCIATKAAIIWWDVA